MAAGALQIAVASMANAIKRISVARGYDVTQYTLQCFGGAGGQHACLVADALGMTRVFVHPLAGVLSAYGMGLADQSVIQARAVERRLDAEGLAEAGAVLDAIGAAAETALRAQGHGATALRRVNLLQVRYDGTDTALPVPMAGLDEVRAAFEAAYRQRFAFLMPDRASLARWLRFEDQPYLPAALDRIIQEARRDRAEYGFSQVSLVLAFLRWHNLKAVHHEKGHWVAVSRSGELGVIDEFGRERERYKRQRQPDSRGRQRDSC